MKVIKIKIIKVIKYLEVTEFYYWRIKTIIDERVKKNFNYNSEK